jgi:hypothetical protein
VEDWLYYATKYDNLPLQQKWRNKKESIHYDYVYLESLLRGMRQAREGGRIFELVEILRSHAFRSASGITDERLYQICYVKTKQLIHDFMNEFKTCLWYVYRYNNESTNSVISDEFPTYMKYDFFNSSKHSMGRSALLLSGGGIMGGYHLGFIKQLYENDMLPRIISGSSAGSIIASFVCTRSYAEIGDVTFNFIYIFAVFEL